MPMIAITTISSTSVKPACRVLCTRRAAPAKAGAHAILLPAADIGVCAIAAFLAVGAPAPHIGLAMRAGRRILIRPSPGIIRQLPDVTARLVMRRSEERRV